MGRTGTLRRLAALSIAACATVLLPATASAAPAAKAANGIGPVGHVNVGLLMNPGGPHKSAKPETKPFRAMNPAALRKAKLQASVAPATSSTTTGPSSAALFNGLDSPGLSAADEGDQPTPPDSTGAIGPTRYVEFVNQLVGVYDRTNLNKLSSTDMGTFTGTPSSLATSDPQMQWDPQGNRWFYADAIPTGSNIPDYPKLGHDANYVMVGDNVYDGSKSSLPFVTADIWAIPKPAASQTTCGGTVSATHFADANHLLKNADGTLAFTPVPANTADSSSNGFIVAAHDPSSRPQSKAMVWHMTPGPVLVPNGDISVGSSYSVPPSVPQPGTSYLVDSLDGRFTQAVAVFDPSANAEAVWTQHTIAGSGRSVVRWYEFVPGSLSIRQQGTLASSTDYYWNAAISPSSVGSDAMISYNRGSASLLSLIGAQTRTSSTPLGQMDAGEVVLGQSSAADQETLFQGNCTSNPCRWGDYSGATPDPLNPGVVWGSNQIDGPTFFGYAQWQTQNFAITTGGAPPAPPGTPTGLVASGIDASSIGLTWNPASSATSYKVQRSPDGSTGWTQVGTSTTTSSTDTGLAAATTYYYRVLASNNVGDSAPSNVASARTAVSIPFSQSPQGSWVGLYGVDGYALLGWNGGDLVSIPNASLSVDQGQRFIWQNPSSDVRGLQSPDASMREATCAYDANQVKIHVTFTAAYTGTIHVYAMDFDSLGRRETITINDGSGPQTATLSSDFSQGAWANASISVATGGTVSVTVNRTAGMNGVVSGIVFGGAPPAPAPPTGLAAAALNSSQVKLTWNAVSGAGIGYQVQRSADGSTGWTQVGTSSTTSFVDSWLIPSATYFYRVTATNGPAISGPSNVASATTSAGLPASQSPQGSWVGVYGVDGSALLGWNGGDLVSIPNASLSVDQGQRFIFSNPSTDVRALQSPDGTTREATCAYDGNQVKVRITFTAAYSGAIHVYVLDFDSLGRRETVTINDGSGPQTANLNSDFSQGAWVNASISVAAGGTVSVTVTRTAGINGVISGIFLGGAPPAPPAPTGLAAGPLNSSQISASPLNSSQISLAWNAVGGATGYKVQRSPDGSTGWTQVGTSNAASFTDSWLVPSTTYFYRVTASNGSASSAPSNVASATTPAGLGTSQSPQGNWVGVFGADGSALLGWNGGDLVSIPNATFSVDQGQRHVWQNPSSDVRGLQSPDASAREATCAFDANQVKVLITFSSAYSGTIHVYATDFDALGRRETITVNDGSGPQTANLNSDFSQGAWVAASISVAAGGTVNVTVTRMAGMNAVVSGIVFGGVPPPPAAPTGLAAGPLNSSQVSLSWNAVSGATGYKIQRSPDGTSNWTQVGSTTTAGFVDSWLIPSTTYFYRVTASNGPSSSAPSNVASATTPAGLPVFQSPQGTWVGVYGASGSALLGWNGGDLVSIPNATFGVDQGQRFIWQNPSSDVRGLQSPDASTRQATCAYDGNQVKIHITFSTAYSGSIHVYAMDFDSLGRRETITINDGSGPQTANLSSDFSQGAWVNTSINVAAGGTMTVTVTRTAGVNAVVSGVFFG